VGVDFGVDLNPEVPNAARIYDYILGGKNNYAADRATADKLLSLMPEVKAGALANRVFLRRAVRELAAAGVDQFLDIGSGLPTQENVHEVAHSVNPDARVVYVDYDQLVVAHGRALLEDDPRVRFAIGDVRRPAEILGAPEVAELIDFSRPVAVLMIALLHFVTDDEDPAGIIAAFRERMAPGSHLALTHVCHDGVDPELIRRGTALYDRASAPFTSRSEAQIAFFFDGFELLEPGLVEVSRWRPPLTAVDDAPPPAGKARMIGGVARLP